MGPCLLICRRITPRDVSIAKDVTLRSGLALLGIVALLCSGLEIEPLQQIDSLCLYLTVREVALEGAVALLLSIAIYCCRWFSVMLLGRTVGVFLPAQRFHTHMLWILWIGGAGAYLGLELFQNLKLEFLPHWHAGANVQDIVALGWSISQGRRLGAHIEEQS
jgi:hypothetical protein